MIRRLLRSRREKRRAVQEQSILDAIGAGHRWYAHDIADAANIRLRDIHTLLARLEAGGRVVAGWDETTPQSEYRRRWYRIAEPTFTSDADVLTPELAAAIDGREVRDNRDGRRSGFDRHVDRALQFVRPRDTVPAEVEQLCREICAAQELYRDPTTAPGLFARAPKEMP